METTTSFDLNQAIQCWLENLSAHATVSRNDLAELESHLRDSMAMLQGQGLSAEEAFHIAARRLGRPADLAQEFGAINQGIVWRQRAFWMLTGMLFWTVGSGVIGIGNSGAVYVGSWFTKDGLLLGWLGGALHLLSLAAVIVAFWLLANGRFAGSNNLGKRWRQSPWRFAGVTVIGVLFLNFASSGLFALNYRRLDPIVLGQLFLVKTWFGIITQLFQMAAQIGGLVWLSRSRLGRSASSCQASGLLMALVVTGLSLAPVAAQDHGNSNRIAIPKLSSATLDDAIKLWRAGKQSEAAEKFLAVDFSKRPLFPTGSVLNMTEAEFGALPNAARDKMSKSILDDIQTVKLIARQVNETAKTALAAQDQTKASLCTNQLKASGEAFDRPGGLALLKLVGQAMKKMAAAHQ